MKLALPRFVRCIFVAILCSAPFTSIAQPNAGPVQFAVDGVAREALIYAPENAKTVAAPVVFVFHGHGGSERNAARTFPVDRLWPEAISVYMQGLPTPGTLTDPEGKRDGWQMRLGDQGDRDLKFFDVVLARLKQDYQVDGKRIYATGHSNGGAFCYLLWAERGAEFAAFAPCAGFARETLRKVKPKPVMHIAGTHDPLVLFTWQRTTMDAVRKINECAAEGTPWADECTLYASKVGAPLIEFIHPGGHIVPAAAPQLIVKFFKEHPEANQPTAR